MAPQEEITTDAKYFAFSNILAERNNLSHSSHGLDMDSRFTSSSGRKSFISRVHTHYSGGFSRSLYFHPLHCLCRFCSKCIQEVLDKKIFQNNLNEFTADIEPK